MSESEPNLIERVMAWADALQRRHTVLGFPFAVVKKYGDDQGGRLAALLAYYGFLSIFPILLLAVVIVARVLAYDPELRERVIDEIVPPAFQDTVDNAVTSLPTGGVAFVVAIVGIVLAGLGIVGTLYDNLNLQACVPLRDRAATPVRYLRSVAVLVLILLTTISIGGLTVLSAGFSDLPGFSRTATVLGVVALLFGLMLATPMLLVARPTPFSAIWFPALISALTISALVLLLGPLLARYVSNAGPVYGTFATIAGLFALLYLVSQVVTYAAEVAAVARARLWPRALVGSNPASADVRAAELLHRTLLAHPGDRVVVECAGDPDRTEGSHAERARAGLPHLDSNQKPAG